jgi:hypothetical protein
MEPQRDQETASVKFTYEGTDIVQMQGALSRGVLESEEKLRQLMDLLDLPHGTTVTSTVTLTARIDELPILMRAQQP